MMVSDDACAFDVIISEVDVNMMRLKLTPQVPADGMNDATFAYYHDCDEDSGETFWIEGDEYEGLGKRMIIIDQNRTELIHKTCPKPNMSKTNQVHVTESVKTDAFPRLKKLVRAAVIAYSDDSLDRRLPGDWLSPRKVRQAVRDSLKATYPSMTTEQIEGAVIEFKQLILDTAFHMSYSGQG
jgi:hypothetical protein